MADRKSFLLRVDPEVLAQLQAWAGEDMRSLNGHIEFLLREALRKAGRLPEPKSPPKAKP
ncbi:MAG TPA: Arc family DNA-binding protein [Holophagaceae bacterium]|nr:Arc family DNA-binding protein [Holophagaceae bacterium]